MVEESGNPNTPFLHGTEVAHSRRIDQPGFYGQMSLLEQETALKRKVFTALIVVASVFVAGLIAGAVVGIFI